MPRVNRPNSKCSPSPKHSTRPPQSIPAPQSIPPHQTSRAPIQNGSPSMMDTMKQGFSFGIGSSIAHNLFNFKNKDENVNKNEIANEPKLTTDKIYELYNKCLENNDRNIDCTSILQNNK
jgi:hypothetical protein